jgi:hypothetical protein
MLTCDSIRYVRYGCRRKNPTDRRTDFEAIELDEIVEVGPKVAPKLRQR